jgi:hypothetical protein
MRAKCFIVAILVSCMIASPDRARSANDSEITTLCTWARTQPETNAQTLDRRIAAALGLGNKDLPMIQYALVNKEPAFAIAIDAGGRMWEFCMLQQTVGDVSVLWNVSPDGNVLAVVRADGGVTKLPKDYKLVVSHRILAAFFDRMALSYLKSDELDRAISGYDAELKYGDHHGSALYGRGIAKLKKGDKTGGDADIAAAKAIQVDIAEEYAGYGISSTPQH